MRCSSPHFPIGSSVSDRSFGPVGIIFSFRGIRSPYFFSTRPVQYSRISHPPMIMGRYKFYIYHLKTTLPKPQEIYRGCDAFKGRIIAYHVHYWVRLARSTVFQMPNPLYILGRFSFSSYSNRGLSLSCAKFFLSAATGLLRQMGSPFPLFYLLSYFASSLYGPKAPPPLPRLRV